MTRRRKIVVEYEEGTEPLSPEENRKLREMIRAEERIQWFWGSVRIWASWISAAIIGAWGIIEILNKVWKKQF